MSNPPRRPGDRKEKLICRQHRRGYRFSVDAFLAAWYCRPGDHDRVLDLGCGNGIIGLLLAARYPRLRVTGLEIQPSLAGLARANIRDNGWSDRCRVVEGDARRIGDFLDPETFELVGCNPPYRSPGRGRISASDEAAAARHEISGGLDSLLAAAAFCVRNRAPVVVVYPASRLPRLLTGLTGQRLTLKRLRPVYGYPEADRGVLVLVEAVKNGGEGCAVEPPLFLHQRKNGDYSPEMIALYDQFPGLAGEED